MSATGFCQDCFKGTLRGDAELTGTVETIHGLPSYVAWPEAGTEPKGIVVIIPDAFGWTLKNSRALADNYAKRGEFLVYLPDFMNGAAPNTWILTIIDGLSSPSPDWWTTLVLKPWWAIRIASALLPFGFWTREAVTRPRIIKFFQDLRSSPAPFATVERLRIGVAGFCWGGYYTVLLAKDLPENQIATPPGSDDDGNIGEKVSLIDCAFTAHPSLISVPKDIVAVKRPLSVANGPDDAFLGREKMVMLQQILGAQEHIAHEVVVYDGAKHGFAVRGDPRDPKQAELGARAEDQAVSWFRKHIHQ
ncbi:Alpha/Beta hydrolase protein [Pseudomassariella vexata]|uniref:Alpha/Beta hydrolase protein n=1 Tax=Pseudomassariella vexata TaxID=1141098 RepID=A0A1Y2EB53_9PEZI|nr:Alpha/Beta hydrolase protein [Pseudomassariella vexata]ORY68800.1 Alpha/Beta hydrolase protein [Pseudomassariella vexata]